MGALLALIAAGWIADTSLKITVSALGALFLVGALIKMFATIDFTSPRLGNGTPNQLAWIRILVCLTALVFTMIEDLPAISLVPAEFRRHEGFFHLLETWPGYTALVSNPHLLAGLQWITAVLLLLGMVGLKVRVTLPLAAVGFFLTQAILRDYTYFFHTALVPLYLLFLLSCAPCAAAWSLDRWLHPAKKAPSRQVVAFSVYACYIVIALIYLSSGLSKLRESGLDWFQGENIRHKLLLDAMNPIFLDYPWKATVWLFQNNAPDFVYSVIGIVGLAVELSYFTVLFSRTARRVMPWLAFMVHLGILVFQHILFLDLLVLQLLFVNADRLAAFVRPHVPWLRPAQHFESTPRTAKEQQALPFAALAAMAVVIAASLLVWVFRVQYYPVSDWQMYARLTHKAPIVYFKAVANLEDGRSIVVPRRDLGIAVMPNSSPTLGKAFRKGDTARFDQFLSSYVERRNRELAFGSRIVGIDVQKWRWNYAIDPHDPHFGWIIQVHSYNAALPSWGAAH